MGKRLTDGVLIVGLAALYTVTARLGLGFDAVGGFATLVWPPTGISLAALLLLGYRVWPGVLIGAAIANAVGGAPIAVALGIATGNTLEALAGAYFLRRLSGFRPAMERVRDVIALIVLAAVVSTVISATIGVVSLSLGSIVAPGELAATWRAWWVGDMVGALLVAPIILVWGSTPHVRFRQHTVEQLAFGAAVVVVSVGTFFGGGRGLSSLTMPFHAVDLVFAILIWAALRFGQRGAATAVFCVSATAIAATASGHGPFVLPELHHGLLVLQTFMALVAATFLLLGATIAERRRALDDAHRAQQEADRANRAKSEFLAVMSHELRTPLNAISGYSELLETGVYGTLTEKQAHALGRIHHNERHLLSLVDEVLGYASAEKGEVHVQREDIPIAEAFDAAEPVLQPELRRKHFVLKRDLSRPGLAVHADPKSLQQILVSLLSNASKYTDVGGTITLGAERQGKQVRIWVSDTGAGIPAAEMQRVFEPFFQATHGPTRQSTGVGLGLTIARDLARRMEGDVTIASRLGRGTTASVVLPAA